MNKKIDLVIALLLVFSDCKVHCFLEVIQNINPAVLYFMPKVASGDEMAFSYVMSLLVSDTIFETDEKTMKKAFAGLKKYPEWYEQAKMIIEQMIEQFQQLISD